MIGQTVGKYRVVSRLGRGGMGTVYKAVDETLDREVAIKCLNPDLGDPELLKRFRAEAVTLARLNHPNIATIFELTEHDGELLMVMEFVRGETFDKVSAQTGPMPVDRAAQLCSQVLDALAHAHRAGIVHRDLKPANLMLTDTGLVKVMDFGLARMTGTEHLTNDGYMVGTPAYMAPEQVLGWEIDGRADLYAMGVVLFRLLTGQLPFKADSGIAMAHKQINDPPTPVRQLRMELSTGIEEMLKRALAKPPGDRYQTADEFKNALGALSGAVAAAGAAAEASPTVAVSRANLSSEIERTLPPAPTPVAMARPAPAAPLPPPASSTSRRPIAVAIVLGTMLLAGVPAIWIWSGRAAKPVAVTPPVSAPVTPPPVVPAAAPAPAAAARPAPPTVTFSKVKLLLLDEGKGRDRDASLRFEPNGLVVADGGRPIKSAAYRDVIGVYHSHAREPRWVTSNGTAVPVGKSSGRFGFLKGTPDFLKSTPDWITVRTRNAFIPLRVQDEQVGRVIEELEARTGTKVVRAR